MIKITLLSPENLSAFKEWMSKQDVLHEGQYIIKFMRERGLVPQHEESQQILEGK